MKLSKCEHGHFFDADKYPACPYCDTALQAAGSVIAAAGAAKKDEAAPTAAPTGPVTGWLVAMDGPARGRDLRLGEGRNFLGTDADGAPVALSADAPLAARQAVVVYDPATAAFTLLPGSARELVYLDGAALLADVPLRAGATLRLGQSTLLFVPFCSAARRWSDAPSAAAETKPAAKKAAAKKPAAKKPASAKPAAKKTAASASKPKPADAQ